MYDRLTAIPNRPLLYDLYRYAWDAKETTLMLNSYITWLGMSSVINGLYSKFCHDQAYHHSDIDWSCHGNAKAKIRECTVTALRSNKIFNVVTFWLLSEKCSPLIDNT